jgi:hypothetical protein
MAGQSVSKPQDRLPSAEANRYQKQRNLAIYVQSVSKVYIKLRLSRSSDLTCSLIVAETGFATAT